MSYKYISQKSSYHPDHKYKIVKFTNGLGKTWYHIKIVGFLWYSWYKWYHNTDYGWTPYIPDFDSEQSAMDHLRREKEKYIKNQLIDTITSSEGEICEI